MKRNLTFVILFGLMFVHAYGQSRLGNFTQRGAATLDLRAEGLTAAHPSLPLNTKVKVTNTRNGKEIEVTVIARIDASMSRIVDLSPGAGQALDAQPGELVILSISPPLRSLGNSSSQADLNQYPGIEEVLERAAQALTKKMPQGSRVAVIYILAPGSSATDFIMGELERTWMDAGYTVIGRSALDRIREEEKFPLSGEVEDAVALSIGAIAEADIIITGRVDGEGNLRRLRLRAIDTHTEHIIGSVSEKI